MNTQAEARELRDHHGRAVPPLSRAADSHAPRLRRARARFLMCAPAHFAIDYAINPWMDASRGPVDPLRAMTQWTLLREVLGRHADIDCLAPVAGLPDLPFTANAGLARGSIAVPSRFRHAERRGEEAHAARWFAQAGLDLRRLPDGIHFEGAGDALFDHALDVLWLGHGPRSDAAAAPVLAGIFGIEALALRLVDPRFYHLDTCFCPLPGGALLWYPAAFDAASRRLVEARIDAARRIAVDARDALAFACNAVSLGNAVVLHRASGRLKQGLDELGFTAIETPLDEFLKSGGSAKCLTLALPRV